MGLIYLRSRVRRFESCRGRQLRSPERAAQVRADARPSGRVLPRQRGSRRDGGAKSRREPGFPGAGITHHARQPSQWKAARPQPIDFLSPPRSAATRPSTTTSACTRRSPSAPRSPPGGTSTDSLVPINSGPEVSRFLDTGHWKPYKHWLARPNSNRSEGFKAMKEDAK